MDCARVVFLLDAFADDELPCEKASRIAVHLDKCPSCNKLLYEINHSKKLLASIRFIEPSRQILKEQRKLAINRIRQEQEKTE